MRDRQKGTAEARGYVPVTVDRIKLIRLLVSHETAERDAVAMEENLDIELANEMLDVLDDSRHLQNEDAWRRMVDLLGDRFGLDGVAL